MSRILVLYYSTHGHIETMAKAVAEGSQQVPDTTVELRRVPELMSEEAFRKAGGKTDQAGSVAQPDELPDYDGIIFGSPTRYGNMCSQMQNFFDRTAQLWLKGALVGKVGSAFTSTATQHGGQETTLRAMHTTLLHLGFVIAGVPYSVPELLNMEEISGGTPYGASTMAGGDGKRQPSENELIIARMQGKLVAELAGRLA